MADEAAAAVREWAPAKINLYLHVTGRRADGYHLLDSLIVFADVADTLTVAPADRFSLTVSGPFAPATPDDAGNLVARATHELAVLLGRSADVAVSLHKVLPVAAGLGGGSADAAAALRALCALWGADRHAPGVHRIAVELGADVPVCLNGRPALVSGIGEGVVSPPTLPDMPVVLVNPGVALSTADVFAGIAPPFAASRPLSQGAGDVAALAALLADCRNDLEASARRLAPAIGDALEMLGRCEGCLLSCMSGSGATCFAVSETTAAAEAAAAALAEARPDWWVRAAICRGRAP